MRFTSVFLALGVLAVCATVQAREYAYSDAHLHYVDFFQETAGMPELLRAMEKNRIQHVMISGIPVAKKWHEDEPKRPRYYAGDDADAYWYSATDVWVAEAVKQLSAEQRRHFHPFLSGFNPNDKNSAAHIQRMLDLNPGLWQGIGEVFTRHDDLTALISGDTPRANNEASMTCRCWCIRISRQSVKKIRYTWQKSKNRWANTLIRALFGRMPVPAPRFIGIKHRWSFYCRR